MSKTHINETHTETQQNITEINTNNENIQSTRITEAQPSQARPVQDINQNQVNENRRITTLELVPYYKELYYEVPDDTITPSSILMGVHNPETTPRSANVPKSALQRIEEFYTSHTEQDMTLEDFNSVADEIIQLMTRKKIEEMEHLTKLIDRMATVVSSRYDQVDKSTLVARLMDIKYEFESFDMCFNKLRRSFMTIIIDN